MENKERYLELSAKLMQMGQSLITEGREAKDFNIAQMGSCLILLGGLLLDEKNVLLFGQMCSMFTAKIILDNMENDNHDYIQYLKKRSETESYEDFIKRINDLRGKNGHGPIKE